MMNIRFDIETSISFDKLIRQDVHVFENDIRKQTIKEVFDTKDQHIRKALIELGWTPPHINPAS
jgi:hypothetical protein